MSRETAWATPIKLLPLYLGAVDSLWFFPPPLFSSPPRAPCRGENNIIPLAWVQTDYEKFRKWRCYHALSGIQRCRIYATVWAMSEELFRARDPRFPLPSRDGFIVQGSLDAHMNVVIHSLIPTRVFPVCFHASCTKTDCSDTHPQRSLEPKRVYPRSLLKQGGRVMRLRHRDARLLIWQRY